jgi:hypothetical protein
MHTDKNNQIDYIKKKFSGVKVICPLMCWEFISKGALDAKMSEQAQKIKARAQAKSGEQPDNHDENSSKDQST